MARGRSMAALHLHASARRGAPRPAGRVAVAAVASVLLLAGGRAWVASPPQRPVREDPGRRAVFAAAAAAGLWQGLLPEEAAHASGGSTAGKYSTIPSAKRRFYGRVRQGIYKFLQMEKPVSTGVFNDPVIEEFFAKTIVKVKGGEQMSGCMFAECKTKEKRTSRWNDFRIASDLLASAFRYDASDINDNLPQVRLIRAYAKKVNKLEKAIAEGDATKAKTLFKNAKMDLDRYTGMVELSPLASEDYTHEWDTRPQVWCQGSFCV